MSGGQQQRVACARALIGRPDLIFADEPTGNLDSNSSSEMLGFLKRSVTEFDQSIVMVTHDPRKRPSPTGSSFSPTGGWSANWPNPRPTPSWNR